MQMLTAPFWNADSPAPEPEADDETIDVYYTHLDESSPFSKEDDYGEDEICPANILIEEDAEQASGK